ncbi:MAG: pantoate--beta-alanine ligase [Candidatus Rokubacteria bacterium]|nr:pantoate--beta-alanine ligase [Candidatus Rokubacteria bacterium]
MAEVLSTIPECRAEIRKVRSRGLTAGLVPTMGALHEGHLSLVRQSQVDCDLTVVSIFVNPLQFGPNEDFAAYPRDLHADVRLLRDMEHRPVLIFAPSGTEMYPPKPLTFVVQAELGDHLCGPFRPGHFRGVLTVVLKLFEIVQPDHAYFGKKDYQQWRMIERMASDLSLPVDVIGMPTVREPDDLAMSSRNRYLSAEERKKALCLYHALVAGRDSVRNGETKAARISEVMMQTVGRTEGVRVDYLSVVDPQTLQPVENIEGRVLLAGAVRLGRSRLIDNLEVE